MLTEIKNRDNAIKELHAEFEYFSNLESEYDQLSSKLVEERERTERLTIVLLLVTGGKGGAGEGEAGAGGGVGAAAGGERAAAGAEQGVRGHRERAEAEIQSVDRGE